MSSATSDETGIIQAQAQQPSATKDQDTRARAPWSVIGVGFVAAMLLLARSLF